MTRSPGTSALLPLFAVNNSSLLCGLPVVLSFIFISSVIFFLELMVGLISYVCFG